MIQLSKKLILGSQSPRRKELLSGMGLSFDVQPIHADESFDANMPVREVAEYVAVKKARAFTGDLTSALLITSDTTVVLDNSILNKPKSLEEAAQMLSSLSDSTHEVVTGVCLRDEEEVTSFSETTEVTFKELSAEEINYYVSTYKPLDKAGAYGIQEWIGQIGITQIKGSYFNVVGLPTDRLWSYLNSFIKS